jgi:hypothetical protein
LSTGDYSRHPEASPRYVVKKDAAEYPGRFRQFRAYALHWGKYVRILPWLCVICLGVAVSVAADAQTFSTSTSVQNRDPRRNSPAVETRVILTMPARLGFSQRPALAAHLESESHGGMPHGVVGATIGAIIGGAAGYARVQMYCDGADPCNATRSTVIGAAIGAAMGAFVEYVIRNAHQ